MVDNMDAPAHTGNNVLSNYCYTQVALGKQKMNDTPDWVYVECTLKANGIELIRERWEEGERGGREGWV